MEKIKVLFLDFDGVLNFRRYLIEKNEYGVVIDPKRMEILKGIIDATNARLVLTTSWRVHWHKDPVRCKDIGKDINRIFAESGLEIFDKTQVRNEGREYEIEMWLQKHPEVEAYAVLDDEFLDADRLEGNFVKTSSFKEGLDREAAQKVIEILNRQGVGS